MAISKTVCVNMFVNERFLETEISLKDILKNWLVFKAKHYFHTVVTKESTVSLRLIEFSVKNNLQSLPSCKSNNI